MSQPNWKFIANLGDFNPIEYGGFFIYEDTTGVYPHEAEYLDSPDTDNGQWIVHRFSIDQCKLVGDSLVLLSIANAKDLPYSIDKYDEWFHKGLESLARSYGLTLDAIRADLCSGNPLTRACAYQCIGEYHGFDNLDNYPLTFSKRSEVEKRYKGQS